MRDLDPLLRDDAANPLPDEGFSLRVMRALPARAARTRPWLRPALVVGSGALGSALAFALAPGEANLLQGFADLARLHVRTPGALMGIGAGAALLISAVALALDSD